MSVALFAVSDQRRRGPQVFTSRLATCLADRGRPVRTVALQSVTGADGPRLDVPALGASRLGPRTLCRLRREIAGASVAVGFGSSTLPGIALAGFGTGVPFVYQSIGDLPFWAGRFDRRVRVRLALRRAAAVVVLWDAARRPIVEQFGVRDDRVHVIPNAADTREHKLTTASTRAGAREELGIDADASVIAIVGSLSWEKRPELAVEALAHMTDCQLLVAGTGPDRARLEELAEKVAPHRVRFLGRVDQPARVYAAADVLLVTSISEGMPGVLVEAGLTGLPAVTTDVGAAAEVVVDGATGAVVPVSASVSEIAASLDHVVRNSRTLGVAARQRCLEHYEIDVVADAWEGVLDQVTR